MWIMMAVSVFLSWLYPFQCFLRIQQQEIVLPSVVMVLIFWALYACVDVCLYASSLLGESKRWVKGFWRRRKIKIDARKRFEVWCYLILKPQSFKPSAIVDMRFGKKAEVMEVIGSVVISKDPLLHATALKWLREFFPAEGVQWLAMAYWQVGAHDLSFESVKDLIFVAKMPSWMGEWVQECHVSLEKLSQCPMPITMPHRSWYPWLRRISVAHVLHGSSIERLQEVLRLMPALWRSENDIQWALIERMFTLGCDKRHEAVVLIKACDERLWSVYSDLYSMGSMSIWQCKTMLLRFKECNVLVSEIAVNCDQIDVFFEMLSDKTLSSPELLQWCKRILTQGIELVASGR